MISLTKIRIINREAKDNALKVKAKLNAEHDCECKASICL